MTQRILFVKDRRKEKGDHESPLRKIWLLIIVGRSTASPLLSDWPSNRWSGRYAPERIRSLLPRRRSR
jgi:hypothetical protein